MRYNNRGNRMIYNLRRNTMKQVVKAVTKGEYGKLSAVNEARGFKMTFDEPLESGGTNLAMNPIEGVLSCLGSCQVITAAAFAKAENFKYEECFVEVEGDFDPEGFMGNPDVSVGYSQLRFTVHFKTDESQEKCDQFAELMAARCPVEANLAHGVEIKRGPVVIEK